VRGIPADGIAPAQVIPPEYSSENGPILFIPTRDDLLILLENDTLLRTIATDITMMKFSNDFSQLAWVWEESHNLPSNK
jgi:hypothetical protein